MNVNLEKIQISGIRRFANKVALVKDAISLTIGQPDFNTPDKIKEAMINAINENKTVYTSNIGIPELRRCISKYLTTMDIDFDAEEICITVGGSEGLYSVFTALVNAGDKVLIPSPAYPAYESIVTLLGGEVINCPLKEDFTMDIHQLEKLIEVHSPKILVLSYPSNPTGAILTEENKARIYEIVKDKDIFIVTDEMYSAYCFTETYHSIAQYKDLKDKIIYLGGFSKMFSMTGLRIGFACAPKKYLDEILKVHQYNVSCAPSIAQYGALAGLEECDEDVKYMKTELIARRDYVYKRLVDIGFDVVLPEGAFYIFPSIAKFNMTSEEFCDKLLYENKVAVVPGSAFGQWGECYIRISYAANMDYLKKALDGIEEFVKKLV